MNEVCLARKDAMMIFLWHLFFFPPILTARLTRPLILILYTVFKYFYTVLNIFSIVSSQQCQMNNIMFINWKIVGIPFSLNIYKDCINISWHCIVLWMYWNHCEIIITSFGQSKQYYHTVLKDKYIWSFNQTMNSRHLAFTLAKFLYNQL